MIFGYFTCLFRLLFLWNSQICADMEDSTKYSHPVRCCSFKFKWRYGLIKHMQKCHAGDVRYSSCDVTFAKYMNSRNIHIVLKDIEKKKNTIPSRGKMPKIYEWGKWKKIQMWNLWIFIWIFQTLWKASKNMLSLL